MTNYPLNRTYSETIRQLETTDKVHADTFNPLFNQIINNAAAHNDRLDGHDASLADIATKTGYYVTPEHYGAKGDGVTDDTNAVTQALNSGYYVLLRSSYKIQPNIVLQDKSNIFIKGTKNSKIIIASSTTIQTVFSFNACSNVIIDGLNFYSTADQTRANGWAGTSSNIYAFHFTNSSATGNACQNVQVLNCYLENFEAGVKGDTGTSTYNNNIKVVNLTTKNTHTPVYLADTTTISILDCYLGCSPTGDKLDHQIYINSNTTDIWIDNITCVQGVGQCISISNSNNKTMPNRVRINNIKAYDVNWGIADLYGTNIVVSNVVGYTTNGTAQQVFYIESNDPITFTNIQVYGTYQYIFAFPTPITIIVQDSTFAGSISTLFNGSGTLTATFKNNTFNRITKSDPTELVYRPSGQDNDILLFEGNIFLLDSNWVASTGVISILNNSQTSIINNTFINYGASVHNQVAYLNPSTGLNVILANNLFKGFNLFVYEGGAFGTFYGNTKIGALQKNTGVSIAASATSYAVTGLSEVDTAYTPNVALGWNSSWWITNKSTSGFTINFGTAPTSSTSLDWSIKR